MVLGINNMLLSSCPSGVAQHLYRHAKLASCNARSLGPNPVAAGAAATGAAGAAGAAGTCAHSPGVNPAHTASTAQKDCHVFMDRYPRFQGLSAPARTVRECEEKNVTPESLWPILRFLRRPTLKNVPKLTVLCFLWCESRHPSSDKAAISWLAGQNAWEN
jgi:hypothetical protein